MYFVIGRFYLSIAVAFPFVGHVFHILFGSTRPCVIRILLYISTAPPTDWRLRFGAKALRRCLIRWHTRHQMVLLCLTSKNFDELPKIEMELSIHFVFFSPANIVPGHIPYPPRSLHCVVLCWHNYYLLIAENSNFWKRLIARLDLIPHDPPTPSLASACSTKGPLDTPFWTGRTLADAELCIPRGHGISTTSKVTSFSGSSDHVEAWVTDM